MDRIAYVGTGAIGGSVAADLIASGIDLVMIDQWPEHVETMRSDGLTVTTPHRQVRVEPEAWHLCDLASHWPTFDLVFVSVDAYDSRWVARLMEPYLADDGVLVGIQNSMTLDDYLEIVGADRSLGCVVELSAQMFEPSQIQRNTDRDHTWMALGEPDGIESARLHRVAEILRNAATVDISSNIHGAKWTKLVTNSMMMGPFALLGLKEQEASRLAGMMDLSIRLGREAAAVGAALGYRLEPLFGLTADDLAAGGDDALRTALTRLLDDVGEAALNTMIQDQLKGRRSEFEFINGLVAARGAELGVPTPANDAVVELSARIDAGSLEMTPGNLERLQGLVAEA